MIEQGLVLLVEYDGIPASMIQFHPMTSYKSYEEYLEGKVKKQSRMFSWMMGRSVSVNDREMQPNADFMWIAVGPFFPNNLSVLDVSTPLNSSTDGTKLDLEIYISPAARDLYKQHPERTTSVSFKLCPLHVVVLSDVSKFEMPASSENVPRAVHDGGSINPV